MIIRPTLSSNQYAVLMAKGETGHVLTIEGDVYRSDDKKVYLIFDSLHEAKLFIQEKQKENQTIDLTIYNSKYELVEYWEATKWKH